MAKKESMPLGGICSLASMAVHIGAFGAPIRPPGIKVAGDVQGMIVPVRPLSFLTYLDPDVPEVHHFWHSNFTLIQCIWADATSDTSKTIVFEKLAWWYARHTNSTLDADFDDLKDATLWSLAYT